MFRPRLHRAYTTMTSDTMEIAFVTASGTIGRPGGVNTDQSTEPYVATKASSHQSGFGVTRRGARRSTIVTITMSCPMTAQALGMLKVPAAKRRLTAYTNGSDATMAMLLSTAGVVRTLMRRLPELRASVPV